MGGGLIQLVAYGAQDVYLTGNPQISFFKVMYSRYTNFAMEPIQQTFTGSATWGATNAISTVLRSGDLLGPMWLSVQLPSLPGFAAATAPASLYNSAGTALAALPGTGIYNWAWVNYIGFRLIKSITLQIGGQQIDKHYGLFMYMWFELTTPASKRAGIQKLVGGYDHASAPVAQYLNASQPLYLNIPLNFFFCMHPGLYLPLIALQYHEVQIKLEVASLADSTVVLGYSTAAPAAADLHFASGSNLTGTAISPLSTSTYPINIQLWAEYVFLDSDERTRFAQNSHEYLIKQVQDVSTPTSSLGNNSNTSVDLKTLNHPCSYLVWGNQFTTHTSLNDWTNFTNSIPHVPVSGQSTSATSKLKTNGNDRFTDMTDEYFNVLQPLRHFTSVPPEGINVYSFGLSPEEHQPSGTMNFSRIDNSSLQTTSVSDVTLLTSSWGSGTQANPWILPSTNSANTQLYAVNYNVLRIMSGMGGLAYAN